MGKNNLKMENVSKDLFILCTWHATSVMLEITRCMCGRGQAEADRVVIHKIKLTNYNALHCLKQFSQVLVRLILIKHLGGMKRQEVDSYFQQ